MGRNAISSNKRNRIHRKSDDSSVLSMDKAGRCQGYCSRRTFLRHVMTEELEVVLKDPESDEIKFVLNAGEHKLGQGTSFFNEKVQRSV